VEVNNFYRSPNIVKVIKFMRSRWVEYEIKVMETRSVEATELWWENLLETKKEMGCNTTIWYVREVSCDGGVGGLTRVQWWVVE
jgi:hypothetical protein